MKIKIKKIIASILTFMMIFTQVPVNVFAADTNISSDGSTYYTSTPGTYNLPGGTYYTKKYSTWENAGTKVRVQYNSSKIGTIALNILGDVINNPDKSGRFDFIRTDRNTDVTINMNGHTFTYSGNDVYSLCGFVENSGTMTINGSGGTIVSDEVGLNSKEGVLNVNDVTIKANRIGIYNEATVLKLKNVKFDESCGTDVQLGSNGTIDLSEYNGNAITIDIDYNINDGKKHRISPRGVSRDDLNKIKFVRNSDKLYRVDLRYDEEGQYIYLAKHVHKWNYVLDNSDESGKIIKGYCSEEDRKSECDYQDPDTTTAKIVLKTKDGGYKKGDNAWVENAAGNNTSSFPISGDSYKLTYYQNGQQLSQRPTEPGDYSVTLTMNQVSVSGEFTITKAEYYTNKIYFKDKNWKEQDNCKYTYQGYQSEFGPYVKVNDGYGHLMDPNYVDSNAVVSYEYKKCDDDDSTYKPISSDKLLAELNSLKPGTYYIRGVVSETNHYLRLTTKSLKFTVLKAEPTPPSIVKYTWEYGEQPELVPESMLDNCQYSYKYYYRDTNVKVNGETVQLDNNNQYTINNIQKNTNITVEGVADITAPDTEIKVSNKTWKSILNKITFGLFFKETQKAEITATDEGSGVNKYYYYVDKSGSEKSLTEKQLQAVDWKEGTSVTFNEDSNYVIYAKVTDKAGNIKYVSTDGIVIDTIAPQVSGVENNQTYTKTQTFTVTDNNLDTVKVDGQTVEPTNGSYTLVPKKGTYTIEVTDKSGNKTTLNNITVNWEKVKKPTVESKVYTGQTLTANISENGLYTVKENNGGIDVNEYDVQLTLKDPTNYRWEDGTIDTTVKFNITQATPVVTKPTTKTLTYNGSEQELVNAASTNGGTVKYSLDNKNWSTSIPTGKAAKEYTVYYKVEGNKNFKDADVQEITNKINPRTIDLKWNKELTYNGKEQLPTATVNNLADGDECEITVDGAQHKNAGTYEATATKVSNQNYKLPEDVTTSYTIKPKDITVTITPNGGTYGEKITGATAKLNDVESGDHPEVTLTYTGTGYDGTEVNGTEVPSHAGKYTVTASIDDKNYNLTDTNTAEFVVKGADAGLKVKEVNDKKYGDQGFKLEVSHKGNGKLSYSSSNEDVATVDDQGNVTIHNAGTTKLKVTLGVDHNYDSDSKEVTLTVNKINHELTVDQKDVEKTYGDEAFTIHAQSKDNESAIEYASSNEKVATVDSEGNVVIKGAGKVIITVSQKEGSNPNYDITFKDGTYTINPLSIDKGTVVLGNVLKYTGEKQTQEVEQVLVNGKALNKEDYEVLDNQATKEGKHVLTIKAKGNNHTGSFEYAYVILPKENDKIGTGSFTVKTTGDVEISRDEIIDLLIENKEITANELSEVAEGKKIEIVLEVKEAQTNELIETNTKGYKVGKYLNITLYKSVNGTNESIHELSKVMKVTIKVPEELINKDSKTKREYYIVRSHNGKVDILETIYDEKTNSLTFETDKFSDYAIIYKDKKELKTTVTTSINKSNTKQTTKAKTGDNANIIGLMMLLVSSMFVMVFVRKKEN